jgi:hypothetical protein
MQRQMIYRPNVHRHGLVILAVIIMATLHNACWSKKSPSGAYASITNRLRHIGRELNFYAQSNGGILPERLDLVTDRSTGRPLSESLPTSLRLVNEADSEWHYNAGGRSVTSLSPEEKILESPNLVFEWGNFRIFLRGDFRTEKVPISMEK